MRILMVSLFAVKSCGPTEVIKKVVPELIKKGNSVDIFSPYIYTQEKEKLAEELGMNYFWYDKRISSIDKTIKNIIKVEKYDIVHIHGIFEPCNWKISAILHRINVKYIFTIHGNLMKNALMKSKIKKNIAILFFIKRMLKNAVAIHVLSQNEKADIRKIIDGKIFIIPNGIDKIHNLERNIDNDKIQLLFIGRIDVVHKGIDILIESIIKMPDESRRRLHIMIVGPYESEQDKLYFEEKLNIPQIKETVSVYDAVYGKEKEKYYCSCDYFFHTSRYEGMPMAVLEALSFGIPCIITKETNLGDIVMESKAGIVVECNLDKIIYALSSLQKGQYNVDKTWIENRLLWKNIANQYIEMYNLSSQENE